MIRRLVPLAIVLLLFAGASSTACNRSSKSGDKAGPGASPSAKVPTVDELKKALLTLSDMPTGYSAGEQSEDSSPNPDDSSSVAASGAECNRLFNEFGSDTANVSKAQVSAEFKKAATGPFVTHTLESYKDAGALQKDMAQVREAVDKCGEFSVKDRDGEAKVKIADASFPKLGDETAAFKLEATVTNGGRKLLIGGYLIAVRVANVVSTIISFGVPTADAAETETIARKAVDKLMPVAR